MCGHLPIAFWLIGWDAFVILEISFDNEVVDLVLALLGSIHIFCLADLISSRRSPRLHGGRRASGALTERARGDPDPNPDPNPDPDPDLEQTPDQPHQMGTWYLA